MRGIDDHGVAGVGVAAPHAPRSGLATALAPEARLAPEAPIEYDELTLTPDGTRFIRTHRAVAPEEADFNLAKASLLADPYPVYNRLRDRLPVHQHRLGFWVFTRYEDLVAIEKNAAVWSNDNRNASTDDYFVEASESWPGDHAIYPHLFNEAPRALATRPFEMLDEPDHKRLRSLVSQAFTRSTLTAYEPRLQELVAETLAAALANDEVNFVGDFAYVLPVTAICELLGVPVEDHALFREWSRPVVTSLEPAFMVTAPEREATRAALLAMIGYLTRLVAVRRRDGREDLISTLIAAEQEGDKLSDAEVVIVVLLLLVAGHETTVNLLGSGLLLLLQHPEQAKVLATDRSLGRQAVDETLRFEPPVQIVARTLLADVEMHGHHLSAGDHAIGLIGAANRDPAIFERPDVYDIQRVNANRHLAFGQGIHSCMGAALARMEGQIALAAIAELVPRLALARPPVYRPRVFMRGPDVVILRHRRRRPARTAMDRAVARSLRARARAEGGTLDSMVGTRVEPDASEIAARLSRWGLSPELGAERAPTGLIASSLHPAEARDPRCLRPEEFDLLLSGAPWRRIVAVGDSTIEGLGDPVEGYQTHSLVERLIAALRRGQPNLRYHNLGARDLKAAEVRARQLERALELDPQLAIVIAGGNDMFPPEWEPDAVERELEAIAAALRERGADLIMFTYWNPVNAVPAFRGTPLDERIRPLNERVRAVAGRHRAILVDSENSPASFDVEVFSHDFKHATMRGHAILAAEFAKAIFAHLQPQAAARLRELAAAPAPAPPAAALEPSSPLVYGEAMDPARLRGLPIFAGASAGELEQLALYAGERGVPAGEPLIQQGNYSHEVIFIETGTADVIRDGRLVAQLGPGSTVGEIGLLRRIRRTASVVTTSHARIITLTSWDLNRVPARVVDRLEALVEERLEENAPVVE